MPSFVTDTSPAFKPSFVKATLSPTFTPSLFITVSPAVTLSTLMSLAKLNVTLWPSLVILMFLSVLFKSTISPGFTLEESAPFAVKFQPLLATSSTFLSCETFTASVSASPGFKPVIFLSPISMPLLLIVTPPTSALSRSFRSLANFTFNVPSPSDSTPILLSDNVPVAPPFTKICSPKRRSKFFAALSPPKVNALKACSAVWLIASLILLTVVLFTVIGALVTVTSPVFKPFVSILVSPAVTLSTLISFDKAILTLPSSTSVLILSSLPTTSTVSPNGFFTELPSWAVTPKPFVVRLLIVL